MASHQFSSSSAQSIEPRVVICDQGDSSSVEILELPALVEIGTEFERQGTQWRIVADRPRTRVLLAHVLTGPMPT